MSEELYDKYSTQYREFAKIDDFNLAERAKKIPAEKHFWVERLIESKRNLIKLERKRKKVIEGVTNQLVSNSPVRVEKKTILESESVEKINEDIQDIKILIEFLDKVVSNISFIAQDIKNIIAIKQMENE
jgi:hypothetical protein